MHLTCMRKQIHTHETFPSAVLRPVHGLIVLLILLTGSRIFAQSLTPDSSGPPIMPDSSMVWTPGEEDLAALRSGCWSTSSAVARACMLDFMRSHSASDAAVRFAQEWGANRYLRQYFTRFGIRVAIVHAPQRIHDPYELLLIDALQRIINVDNDLQIPRAALMRDVGYRDLHTSYPSIAFHPADRSPLHRPQIESFPGGRTRVIVEYRLTDGCRACARIGYARVAFYFNSDGTYIAQKFLGVWSQPPLRPDGAPADCDESNQGDTGIHRK